MPQVTATKLPMVGVIQLHISWCVVKLVCLWGSGLHPLCNNHTLVSVRWHDDWMDDIIFSISVYSIRLLLSPFQAICQPLRRYCTFIFSSYKTYANIDQCSGCESCCWNGLSRWRWRSSELLKTWHLRSQLCAPWTWDVCSCFAFWEVGRLPFSILSPMSKGFLAAKHDL